MGDAHRYTRIERPPPSSDPPACCSSRGWRRAPLARGTAACVAGAWAPSATAPPREAATTIANASLGTPRRHHAGEALGTKANQRADRQGHPGADRFVHGVHPETERHSRPSVRRDGEGEERDARLEGN